MKRKSTVLESLSTGRAVLDLGDQLETEIALGRREYTVKETAGRTVTVWDYLNNREQLIYGETGKRNILGDLIGATGGQATLSRSGNMVQFVCYGVSFSDIFAAIYFLPNGFRPITNGINMAALHIDQTSHARTILSANNYSIATRGGENDKPAYIDLTFQTADPWPTSLPGVAA